MALAGQARRALGRTVRWERRTIGMTDLIPRPVRSKLRRFLGIGSLQDARRYTRSPRLEELFDALHRRNASYVVMRWFEDLPASADGDVDFLIGDDSLPLFEALLDGGKDGVPCDLYSASGARGYLYSGMPYYPPLLGQRILARCMTADGNVRIPCPEDHFFSLAYHALYQKGFKSGLPTALLPPGPAPAPMHDYLGTLARLAATLQFPVDITMESLDAFLATHGWRPPEVMVKQLARHNDWLRAYFGSGGVGAAVSNSQDEISHGR